MIEQVLVNLITNACQAMEGIEGTKHLEIASAVQDGRIVLRVSDSGPGVPPSLREKIFDPFFTTRKDGSGIGLSFSHRIVADHGGTLRVDTSRWGGRSSGSSSPSAKEGAGMISYSLFIVEDEESVRDGDRPRGEVPGGGFPDAESAVAAARAIRPISSSWTSGCRG